MTASKNASDDILVVSDANWRVWGLVLCELLKCAVGVLMVRVCEGRAVEVARADRVLKYLRA